MGTPSIIAPAPPSKRVRTLKLHRASAFHPLFDFARGWRCREPVVDGTNHLLTRPHDHTFTRQADPLLLMPCQVGIGPPDDLAKTPYIVLRQFIFQRASKDISHIPCIRHKGLCNSGWVSNVDLRANGVGPHPNVHLEFRVSSTKALACVEPYLVRRVDLEHDSPDAIRWVTGSKRVGFRGTVRAALMETQLISR